MDDRELTILDIAGYIILHHGTIRNAAMAYCLGKSTVHQMMTESLPKLDKELSDQVATILRENWDMKHIHGGEATAKKYEELRKLRQYEAV